MDLKNLGPLLKNSDLKIQMAVAHSFGILQVAACNPLTKFLQNKKLLRSLGLKKDFLDLF